VIDVQQVRELIELMVEHDLSEIRVREGETAISLRKGMAGGVEMGAVPTSVVPAASPALPPDSALPAPQAPPEPDPDEGLIPIPCPMVGTYYSASEPELPPYVSVGSEVEPDTPICIIEAMKVFNEIKAEVAGTIERVLVQNQQAVEFGEPLMLVRPRS